MIMSMGRVELMPCSRVAHLVHRPLRLRRRIPACTHSLYLALTPFKVSFVINNLVRYKSQPLPSGSATIKCALPRQQRPGLPEPSNSSRKSPASSFVRQHHNLSRLTFRTQPKPTSLSTSPIWRNSQTTCLPAPNILHARDLLPPDLCLPYLNGGSHSTAE